jgi:hypothetical protein
MCIYKHLYIFIYKMNIDDKKKQKSKSEIKDEKIKNYYKNKNIQEYYKNKYMVQKQVSIYRELRKDDVIYKIVDNLARRACNEMKIKREITHLELIGCDYETLRKHLEFQFIEGMNFDNYGKWELDHILPVSSFNMTDIEEIKKCFNYKNIQPLWEPDNKAKYNKIFV